ncbi:post-transcriptional regulator [Jeotgalibacillus sp. ET6]|uniref:post-transcriptional regulator n=1 Tax=Jeotgalibacillus sp. ET6 TaxID=3037260 RepID=UPI002418B995|nr:post-transcriptional regulator [Jeotgalibacillus sp. ET6]MDG5470921.1 post-transcriptional regulator [Jeotgalibacillus sp. ET6]
MYKHTSFEEVVVQLGPALSSKREELHLYGYDSVTEQALWQYLVQKKWKKCNDEIPLYAVVNDILTIKAGDYMNWTTRNEYKASSQSVELNEEELHLLLHGEQEINNNGHQSSAHESESH